MVEDATGEEESQAVHVNGAFDELGTERTKLRY